MDEIDADKLAAEWEDTFKDYRFEDPNWEPLEKVMPIEWCGAFMWMAETRGIHLYKHGFTRHYLNLDEDGNAYRFVSGSELYVPMDLGEAIEAVFEGLEWMRRSRSSPYDDDAVKEKHEALAKAGWTTVNLSPNGVNVTEPKKSNT